MSNWLAQYAAPIANIHLGFLALMLLILLGGILNELDKIRKLIGKQNEILEYGEDDDN